MSTTGMRTIVYPVKDLALAKALYGQLLGAAPHSDFPYYVGFSVGGVEVGLDPHGHAKGLTGAVDYWDVDDIEATHKLLVDAGAEELQPIGDVGGGKLIATLTDADGNIIGLMQSP